MNEYKFKVAVLGEKCGKTTFLERIARKGDFSQEYVPTLEVELSHFRFRTNHGTVDFTLLDIPSCFPNNKKREICKEADALIIMYDVTSDESKQFVVDWTTNISSLGVPSFLFLDGGKNVIVGNKFDLRVSQQGELGLYCSLPEYVISAKTMYNIDKPFFNLAQQLLGKSDLAYTS